MATGWTIEIGYNSGATTDLDHEGMQVRLAAEAQDICVNPVLIYQKAIFLGSPKECECGANLVSFCEKFRAQNDATIEIGDKILMMATGGDACRAMKEYTRRAFCLLLAERMYSHGIGINIIEA